VMVVGVFFVVVVGFSVIKIGVVDCFSVVIVDLSFLVVVIVVVAVVVVDDLVVVMVVVVAVVVVVVVVVFGSSVCAVIVSFSQGCFGIIISKNPLNIPLTFSTAPDSWYGL